MKKQQKPGTTPKKKSIKIVWDYIAALAFILVGCYYLGTQRPSQGAIYITVGLFFSVITRSRGKKHK